MDLLDFDKTELYFDEPLDPEVARLLIDAADAYGSEDTEVKLLNASWMAPQHLMVLVALYRFYFYQHRLEDVLLVAECAMAVSARRLGFGVEWQHLRAIDIGTAAMQSMGLLRFYLMVIKATGYVHLRLGNIDTGRRMLEKLVELDQHDRIGGKALLDVLQPGDENTIPRRA